MSRMMVVEGSIHESDKPDPPYYCPLCGRVVEAWRWPRDGSREWFYPSFVCWGDASRLRRWWHRRWSITEADGVHYRFSLPMMETRPVRALYDRKTGEPL